MEYKPVGWDEVFDPTKTGYDSILPFLGLAHALAADAETIVEVGCGRGSIADLGTARPIQDLRGPGRTVIGIDIAPVGAQNPLLDEFRLIPDSGHWPVEDGSADLAVSDFVLEHVDDPVAFVAELTRVLRPGGALVARTVSRYSPLSTFARLVPNRGHAGVLRNLQPGRKEQDVFPTRYRMNTRRDLARLFDPDYTWAVSHRGGLDQYLLRWPGLARTATVLEPRLPRVMHTALVVYARRRP